MSNIKDKDGVVYAIVNKVNGKRYIGSTINPTKRHSHHVQSLNSGSHPNNHLQREWNEYGEDNFEFIDIAKTNDYSILRGLESTMIKVNDATNPEIGYNKFLDTGSQRTEYSDEFRQKASVRGKEIGISDKCREAQAKVFRGDVARAAQAKAVEARKRNGSYGRPKQH